VSATARNTENLTGPQLAVDTATQLIAGVDLVNIVSDMGQMVPMHEQIEQRYGHTPGHWLADGGYSKLQAIDAVTQRGTQPVMPPPRSRDPGIDPFILKSTGSPNVAQWRARMASDDAKALYKLRAATIECTNAQVRRRGLHQFLVRGRLKTRGVLLWHALAHNLVRMRSFNIAFHVWSELGRQAFRSNSSLDTARGKAKSSRRTTRSAIEVTDLAGAYRAVTAFCRHSRRQSQLVHTFSPDPVAFERGNYLQILSRYEPPKSVWPD
jgi:hypothetical protein